MKMPTDKYEVKMIAVELIKNAGFEPEERLAKDRLLSLVESIRSVGLMYHLIVSRDMFLIDGHRRLAALKVLQWSAAPCRIVAVGLQDGFYESNSSTMTITSKQWGNAYINGLSEAHMPKNMRQSIDFLKSQISAETIEYVVSAGYGLRAIKQALTKLTNYISFPPDITRDQIVKWLVRHNMQYMSRKAIESGIEPGKIIYAVREDRPLVQTLGMIHVG